MKSPSKKNLIFILTGFICVVLLVVLLLFFKVGNVTVGYYDQVSVPGLPGNGISGFGPCETNVLSTRSDIKFVFTEPFTSLNEFDSAKIKKEVIANQGSAKLVLAPGKYGLYIEFPDGTKRLYSDLVTDNSSEDKPRNEQGPWYVHVNLRPTTFDFRESNPC